MSQDQQQTVDPKSLIKDGYYFVEIPAAMVAKNMEYYMHFIESSLPPNAATGPFLHGNIMRAVNAGKLQVYAAYKLSANGEKGEILCVFTLIPTIDAISGARYITIYSFATTKDMDLLALRSGLKWLKGLAREREAGAVLAYTDNEKLADAMISASNDDKTRGFRKSFVLKMEM